MRFYWLVLCWLFPLAVMAQHGIIRGKVIRSDLKSPIPQANVFLGNTSYATATDNNGTFVLNNLRPGQYTLIVTIIGYESYSQTVMVGNEPLNIDIQLNAKVNMLREVSITTAANWKKNYEQFVKEFIGTDENAKSCFIMNPHELNLSYHKAKQLLNANTFDFLVVENRALGYRIKCQIDSFAVDDLKGTREYLMSKYFEELPGNKKQLEIWHKNREAVYYGSRMHFYRSLYNNTLDSEGFIMMRLTRSQNPNRAPEATIQQKLKYFNNGHSRDSLKYWLEQEDMSKYYHENLDRAHLYPAEIAFFLEDHPGLDVINFKGYCLYVMFTRKMEQSDFRDIYRPLDMPNYQTSVITLYEPYVFDANGVESSSKPPLYEGTWTKSMLSDMLPDDYVPDVK